MQEKEDIPAIRFDGFTDDWEQRKLGEICEKVIEKNADKEFTETFTNSAEFGIISQRDFFDHDIAKQDKIDGYYIVHPEDFVYNPRISVTAPVGPIKRNKLGRCGVMSPLYSVFRPEGMDNTFLEQFFKSSHWHSFMRFNGDSGARSDRFSIKDTVFFEMPIPCPNLQEQEQIGIFLSSLDRLITLHQRKYSQLCNIKKSMLERMFPREEAIVPEIRFAGFTDAWEQRKFSELYCRSNEKNDGSVGIERNITVATMQFKPDVQVTSEEYLKTYFTFKLGDIAFEGHQSKEFRYGRFVENDIGDGIISHIFVVFRPITSYDLSFWKYAINNETLMQRILSKATKASTMMHDLVTEDFLRETFLVPSIEEQKKIGSFFRLLDRLITLHQRELERLQNIKKACLEKMFV